MRAASGTLSLRASEQLRERRESQVTLARAREAEERLRRITEDIRRMSAIYRERLVGNRERDE